MFDNYSLSRPIDPIQNAPISAPVPKAILDSDQTLDPRVIREWICRDEPRRRNDRGAILCRETAERFERLLFDHQLHGRIFAISE